MMDYPQCAWSVWCLAVQFLLMTIAGAVTDTGAGLAEYCEGEDFVAKCQEDEVIVITVATYGRMRRGKCVSEGVIGCSTDVLELFDLQCSGQHECQVRVSSIIDDIPEHQQPCSRDFRSYLEASFECVKVVQRSQESCIALKQAEVTETTGYIASVVTDETTCGSIDSPWILRMGQGQTIEIELYDFAVAAMEPEDNSNVCHVYAIIKEKGGSETICGSLARREIVYRSMSDELEIRLVTKRKNSDDGYFVLKYRAIGCADPATPPNGWMQRVDDKATLGCNASSDEWEMICEGEKWSGKSINCTQVPGAHGPSEKAIIGIFTGSQWASIVIILAIAVTLGLVIFLVGLVFIRRKRNNQARQAATYRPSLPDMYSTQYRDSGSTPYNTKPLSAIDCSNSENDYYRTWQLQRHPPGGRFVPSAGAHGSLTSGSGDMMERLHHPGLVCTNPHCAQRPYDTMDADKRYPMEHIYESPKFDRREVHTPQTPAPPQNQTSVSTTGSSTQYFELDPDQV